MSDCTWLSDRMPSVALRQAEWSAEEKTHLSGCSSCRSEWELVQAGVHLGALSPPIRNPDALVAMLRQSRRREALRGGRTWALSGLAAAAAIVAAVGLSGRHLPSANPREGAVVAGLQMPLPELESLQPAELESVLQAMDDSILNDQTLNETGLVDLDSDELQQVLDTWEG